MKIEVDSNPPYCHFSLLLLAAAASILFTALALPAKADQGGKEGWSVSIDPRKRAFLHYVPAKGDARVLTIGCLRDVDSFTILSTGLKTGINNDAAATLSLSSGATRYAVDGKIEVDPTTEVQTFDVDIDADANGLRKIAARLLPVLQSGSPITLSIGAAELSLPTSSLAQPLSRFMSTCREFRLK